MHIDENSFSATVDLPCRVFCGPESLHEVSGTAVNIGTAKLLLELKRPPEIWAPAVGDRVRLELLLPVSTPSAAARCLSFRARVTAVSGTPAGGWRVEFTFRKPSFKDLEELALKDSPETEPQVSKWEM